MFLKKQNVDSHFIIERRRSQESSSHQEEVNVVLVTIGCKNSEEDLHSCYHTCRLQYQVVGKALEKHEAVTDAGPL